ncbi:hypothetical protein COY16_04630 [Candidatus Roizmanbacteria bacterium CG_4_10_14_0_2_um_filter_39_13]|uniref:ParB/Spo0J HTH domain-containing protein n=1 Tax=Candidatus Roizmanbacteria bacterium CG_4_10_14_0_2_um_filter_39_13 TaxID=1974825 RepID=A0A2M7TWY7_9BACT|nr:MAG: hypothetical protein COY16_04630 [Candidatus Roizmanbacteria bacterium CG_4_10_14_0_2_um_filter_39_13]
MNTKSTEELFELLKQEQDILRKARLIHHLRIDKEVSLKKIAEILKKHPSYVSHMIRLLRIPQLAADGYYSGQISSTHLMILSRLQTEEQMKEAYEEILKKELTAPQTETLIRQLKFDVASDDYLISPKELAKISNSLQEKHESRVRIYQSRVRGKLVIEKRGKTKDTAQFIKKLVKLLEQDIQEGHTIEVLD